MRFLWDRGSWVESTSYRANGRPAVVCSDRFPRGVMCSKEFGEEGRTVSSQEW